MADAPASAVAVICWLIASELASQHQPTAERASANLVTHEQRCSAVRSPTHQRWQWVTRFAYAGMSWNPFQIPRFTLFYPQQWSIVGDKITKYYFVTLSTTMDQAMSTSSAQLGIHRAELVNIDNCCQMLTSSSPPVPGYSNCVRTRVCFSKLRNIPG